MTKRKKRIPRFSLRSLLVLTFVAGAYFALGPPTKSYGVPAVSNAIESEFGSPGNPAYVRPPLRTTRVLANEGNRQAECSG